jgi:hypothetical protein
VSIFAAAVYNSPLTLWPRRRYSHDAIHNLIASSPRSQSTLQPGGYSRVSAAHTTCGV